MQTYVFDIFQVICYYICNRGGVLMKYQVGNSKDINVEINTDIFKLLYPESNDALLKMTDSDRVYFIMLLKKYYLAYRDKLNIDKDVTFGLEIEFEEAYRDLIELNIYSMFDDTWIVADDRSLSNGGEVKSPVLRDTEKTWIDLSSVCNIVDSNAYVLDNSSAHVHIGMQILGNNPKYWYNFALLWMTYENVISRFLYGEYVTARPRIMEFAPPISKDLIYDLDRLKRCTNKVTALYILKVLEGGRDRYQSINFTNIADDSKVPIYKYNTVMNKNTIEFRGANGTFNPIIWQNNVNLLVKLLEYAKNDNFDEETIIKRLKGVIQDGIPSNLDKYARIYIDEALELADLIFTNNLDKVYFLRQYVKSGEVSTKPLVKSKRFTM